MGQARIQLIEANNGFLDIKEGTAFPINISLGDVRDISKRNGSFSRTVTVVGNKNSHKLLNHYYDVNIEAGTFDINRLQKCLVEQDGVIILDNLYLQLTGVKKVQKTNSYEQEIEYEVEIKDSASDFFIKINNLELTDIDLSVFNHTYNATAVTDSFTHTYVDGYKYVMPYIDNSNSFLLKDFKPGVYVRTYWDKIFANAGYTYDFAEANTDDIQFDKLFIPYNGDVPKPGEDIDSWIIATTSASTLTAITNSFSTPIKTKFILEDDIQNINGYYNPTTGEFTSPIEVLNPDSYVFEFDVTYNIILENNNPLSNLVINSSANGGSLTKYYGLKLYSNDSEVLGFQAPVPIETNISPLSSFTVISNLTQTLTTKNSNLNVGDIIETYFSTWQDDNSSFWASPGLIEIPLSVDVKVEITSISVTIKPSLETFVLNSSLTLNTFIPKKIKQSEFIKSICQMYNLLIEGDPSNTKNLIIRTRDEFYDSGVVKDWTKKLAKDQEQNLKFLPELSSKRIILSYKDDSDSPNKTYKGLINETYGQVEYVFENEYVKNVERKDLIFSPTPNTYTNFQANVPMLVGPSPKTNIRILLDNGLYSCFPYTIAETSATTISYSTYPFISHFNDAENPTFDINYATCDYYFYNPDSLTNNNLYNLHWRRTFAQINGGKLLTAQFYLNAVDIQTLKLNDKIRIDNSYWNINKVIDYDANANKLTTVELISIDEELELPPFNSYGATEDNITGNVILPVDGDIFISDKGKLTNAVGKNRDFYLNIDSSNGKVKNVGIQNQTSNLITGTIVGDKNFVNGVGNAYVDGSNNNLQSSAYVIANDVTVDENLENVFVFRDSTTADTSNTMYLDKINARLLTGTSADIASSIALDSFGNIIEILPPYCTSDSNTTPIVYSENFLGGGPNAAYSSGNLTRVAHTYTATNVPIGDFVATYETTFDVTGDPIPQPPAPFANVQLGSVKFRLYIDGVAASSVVTYTNSSFSVHTLLQNVNYSNPTVQDLTVELRYEIYSPWSADITISQTDLELCQVSSPLPAPTLSWEDVLSVSNLSGPNNPIISSEQYIISANGGGRLDLDYSGNTNDVLLSNDNATSASTMLHLTDYGFELNSFFSASTSTIISDTLTTSGSSLFLNHSNDINIVNNPTTAVGSEKILVRDSNGDVKQSSFGLSALTASSGLTWSDVLTNGNTSGPNDAIMDTTQVIKSDNGGGQIDLDYGGSPNSVLISNDNGAYGKGVIYLQEDFLGAVTEVSNYAGRVYSYSTVNTTIENNNNQLYLTDSNTSLWRNNGPSDQGKLEFTNGLGYAVTDLFAKSDNSELRLYVRDSIGTASYEFIIKDNTTNAATSANADNKAIFIGTNNSTINSGVTNSVVIGGAGHSISSDDSTILGGIDNTLGASSTGSMIAGGNDVTINSFGCLAIGDTVSITDTSSQSSVILGGSSQEITNASSESAIIGGFGNRINGAIRTVVLGGNNIADATYDNTVYQQDSYRDAGNHTITTTNNTITDLYTFTPDTDGVWMIEANTTGFEIATGDAIGAKSFATFKVIAGVVTAVSTNTLDRKSNFPAGVTVLVDTNGTVIRIRVTGRAGSTINWKTSLTLTK